MPGSGEPFPAVVATLVPAAKCQRTACGTQRTASQHLQELKAEIEAERAAAVSRIESPLETAQEHIAQRDSIMQDVLPVLIPGGGESFYALGEEPSGERSSLAACVSASCWRTSFGPRRIR